MMGEAWAQVRRAQLLGVNSRMLSREIAQSIQADPRLTRFAHPQHPCDVQVIFSLDGEAAHPLDPECRGEILWVRVLAAAREEDTWIGQILNQPRIVGHRQDEEIVFRCRGDGLYSLTNRRERRQGFARGEVGHPEGADIRNPRTEAAALFANGKFDEALRVLFTILEDSPEDWNALYLAGQCYRFLGDYGASIGYLRAAAKQKPRDGAVLLALGIALQLKGVLPEAVEVLAGAIRLDGDYAEAFNSLALTQKKMGKPELAAENYDAGMKALARRIARTMINDVNNRIVALVRSRHDLWGEHALYAATFLAARDGAPAVAWLSGKEALEESRTRRHGGLYYRDIDDPGRRARLFLPNFFHTFCERLRADWLYANLTGNRGSALQALGRADEAQVFFDEAVDFSTSQHGQGGGGQLNASTSPTETGGAEAERPRRRPSPERGPALRRSPETTGVCSSKVTHPRPRVVTFSE